MATSPDIPELISRWETRHPDEWALCYPKQYQVSSTYASPKQLALNLIEFLAPQKSDPNKVEYSERMGYLAAANLIRLKVPLFFVAPDLFTSVQKSTPPGELDWVNMRLPFDSAAFVLPRGSLVHESRGEVDYLWYTRLRKHDPLPSYPGIESAGVSDDDCFMIFAPCMSSANRRVPGLFYFGSKTPVLDLKDADRTELSDPVGAEKAGLLADDMSFLSIASTLLCNLLLVMDARKELLTPGQWNGKKTSRGLEFWTPNMLGKDYVLRRPSVSGDGPTPRMHWRRGHVRQQPYGEGHSLRRALWIEPTLVAAS